jgi:antitoxin ParD1/3/4
MSTRASLNVSLTPEPRTYIAELVAPGRYRSASEVVRASLRLLQRDEPARSGPSTPLVAKPDETDQGDQHPERDRPRWR